MSTCRNVSVQMKMWVYVKNYLLNVLLRVEVVANGHSPLAKNCRRGNGTIFVLSSFKSTFKLPGNLEPLEKSQIDLTYDLIQVHRVLLQFFNICTVRNLMFIL